MKSFSLSCLVITALLCWTMSSCNKELQTMMPPEPETEIHHGFLYIGCAVPPYYMNFDSLVTNCSVEGPLPQSLSAFTLNSDTTAQFCRFDGNEAWIGTATNYDVEITHQNSNIITEIGTSWINVDSEAIPITIEGVEYDVGEGTYLGGFRLTTASEVATVQVINAYVGGCFHNVVVWSFEE